MKKIILLLLLMIPLSVRAIEEDNLFYLESLSIEGYEITPTFDKYNNIYTLIIEDDISFLEVNATAEEEDSYIELIGNDNLREGENYIYISLFNEEYVNTYQIIITIDNKKTENVFKELTNDKIADEVSDKEIFILIGSGLIIILIVFRVLFIKL